MNKLPVAELERQVLDLGREVQRLRRLLGESEEARVAALRTRFEWEGIFAALPDFATVIDRDFRIVCINHFMAEQLNLRAEDAIGRSCYEVMHAAGAPPAFCPHALAMADGRRHAAEIYEPTLDSFFLVTASPLLDADGRVTGSLHVARELPHKRHEDAERQGLGARG